MSGRGTDRVCGTTIRVLPTNHNVTMPSPSGALERRLGLGDAVVIGLGSMIGAGVFAAFAPAAKAAGSGLLIGLAVAAIVAYCNATSSARLAALVPGVGRHVRLWAPSAR